MPGPPTRQTLIRGTFATIAVAVVALFAGFIWPTPWRNDHYNGIPIRVNRLTGNAQSLCSDGWHDLEPDMFADLGDGRHLYNVCELVRLPQQRKP